MSDLMRESYATIVWSPLDVKWIRPEWTDEQCMEALDTVCSDLENRSIEEGWNILEALIAQYSSEEG